jgi:hypothetical protein
MSNEKREVSEPICKHCGKPIAAHSPVNYYCPKSEVPPRFEPASGGDKEPTEERLWDLFYTTSRSEAIEKIAAIRGAGVPAQPKEDADTELAWRSGFVLGIEQGEKSRVDGVEIADEEIAKAAREHLPKPYKALDNEDEAFIAGAKWYRERITKKQ